MQENTTEGVEGVSGRLRPQADLFVGLGLILFGALAAFESWRMPRFAERGVQLYEAPGLVPGLLGLIIAGFGLLILVRAVREGGIHQGGRGEHFAALFRSVQTRRLTILVFITLGYAWGLVGRIPFWLATFVFVLLFIVIFDWRDAVGRAQRTRLWATASIQAVLTSAIVTYVFEYVFRVRLP